MMADMNDDEFAEFDLSEAEIDAMMQAGTPVEIVTLPILAPRGAELYTLVTAPSATYATSAVSPHISWLAAYVSTSGDAVQTANLAA